jgi:hypothetical protein
MPVIIFGAVRVRRSRLIPALAKNTPTQVLNKLYFHI